LDTIVSGISFNNNGKEFANVFNNMYVDGYKPETAAPVGITYEKYAETDAVRETFTYAMEGILPEYESSDSSLSLSLNITPDNNEIHEFRIYGESTTGESENEDIAWKKSIKVYVKTLNALFPEAGFSEQEFIDNINVDDGSSSLYKEITVCGIKCECLCFIDIINAGLGAGVKSELTLAVD
jgi:hypothetical protein